MKKNKLTTELINSEFLFPLDFLLRLSGRAYEKYMKNKIYLHALNIRKANEMIYRLILDKIQLVPDEIQNDCIELLNHFDCWMLQFNEEENRNKPTLKEEFIFYRIDDQMAYPRLSEQHIFSVITKFNKQKNK